jgi:hypothetical protein
MFPNEARRDRADLNAGRPTHSGLTRKASVMTTRYYRTPPPPVSTRVRCPVCHAEVYSRAGIHPQCAVRQCDPPRPKNSAKPVVGAAELTPVDPPVVV